MFLSRLEFSLSFRNICLLLFVSAPLATAGAAPLTLQRTYLGDQPRDQFGFAVHAAGDVNRDGYADFLVGANASDAGAAGSGAVALYVGGDVVASAPLGVHVGMFADANCGAAIGGGADLNGDGFDDWVAGAPGLGTNGNAPGSVYVFLGSATPDVVPDRILAGVVPGGQFGAAVLLGPDLDGDGQGDLVIAAPRAGNGEIHIYRGGPDFLAAGAARVVHARGTDGRFGKSLAWLPDADGDGCDDLLVGVPRSSQAATWAGAVLLYRGTAALDTLPDLVLVGQTAGDEFGTSIDAGADVDGDGAADVVVGAPFVNVNGTTDAGRAYVFRAGAALDALADRRFDGTAAGGRFGSAVALGFDWDGDGQADIAIGEPGADDGGTDAGRSAIFRGGTGLDAVVDATVLGPTAAAQLGSALARLGDIRHNRRTALLLGAHGASDNGRALLYASTEAPVDAAAVLPLSRARLLPVWPNPSAMGVQSVLETLAPARWRIDVFDARGRLVRHLFTGSLAPGAQAIAWDGREHSGHDAAAGVYCIRAASAHAVVMTRAVLVR